MATLTPFKAKVSGTTVTLVPATVGGDKVDAGDGVGLLVLNGSGGSINVTVAVPGNTKFGQAEPDIVVAVAAGAYKIIALESPDLEDTTDKLVHITYSAVTTVSVAVIEI